MSSKPSASVKVSQKRSLETKKGILDAAERLFSERGFHGTSMRDITALSGSRISLCYYHFGTKDDVLQAVVDRRAEEHMEYMLASLGRAIATYEECVPVSVLIEAFMRPCLERHHNSGPGWRNYVRLLAHLASESASSEYAQKFFQYDSVNEAFFAEFKRSLPEAADVSIHWGFYFLQTANINLLLDTHLADHQSKGQCNSSDIELVIESVKTFFNAGFGGTLNTAT
jgi:AcrR family transcriptional regulator|tara:strand:- start:1070 stop:1750 length:681 start_codon:yes stop_codon:yes gene_type:complete